MSSAPRILVVYAHPTHRYSKVNRRLIDAARSLPNVLVDDLYETYPDFYIDVEREQTSLAGADLIVFQHPIQWYSMPSLLKEWVDVVLEDGWAYGPSGTALLGKDFWLVATTGGPGESYHETGYHRHSFSAFLPPIEQTIDLCGMRWLPPLILHGAHQVDDAVVEAHAERYRQRLATYPDWPELRAAHADPIVKRNPDS
jgi:putative NADPH-quinone reductase